MKPGNAGTPAQCEASDVFIAASPRTAAAGPAPRTPAPTDPDRTAPGARHTHPPPPDPPAAAPVARIHASAPSAVAHLRQHHQPLAPAQHHQHAAGVRIALAQHHARAPIAIAHAQRHLHPQPRLHPRLGHATSPHRAAIVQDARPHTRESRPTMRRLIALLGLSAQRHRRARGRRRSASASTGWPRPNTAATTRRSPPASTPNTA